MCWISGKLQCFPKKCSKGIQQCMKKKCDTQLSDLTNVSTLTTSFRSASSFKSSSNWSKDSFVVSGNFKKRFCAALLVSVLDFVFIEMTKRWIFKTTSFTTSNVASIRQTWFCRIVAHFVFSWISFFDEPLEMLFVMLLSIAADELAVSDPFSS